ncbi:MAG: hypothetical protein NXY57DRAFT_968975, partial [Lentinula lateritia]
EQEAAIAAKRKRTHVSPPREGLTKKKQSTKTRSQPGAPEAVGEVPRVVRLVFPPARPAPPPSFPSPLRPSSPDPVFAPRVAPVSRQTGSVRDPESLVQLAEVAGRQTSFASGSAAPLPMPPPSAIKGPWEHPYRAENERLITQVRLLELQLASSRQENSTLTSALRDTSTSLEARQGELDQLRASVALSSQRQEEYERLMDQFQALQRLLPGPIDKSLVDRFPDFEELSHVVCKERDKYLSRSASSNHRNEELEKSLIQQQSVVDESNALAVRQRKRIEALQEEVHRFRERALFMEEMVREYPEEGSYSVSLPPLAEVQGQLNDSLASLRRVATFAHRLYRSNPATWFFHNAAEREEGTYRLILNHSRFADNAPFLNAAQHAGFVQPFNNSLEPPLHCRMFALETALPHHGLGNWEDLVPAVPNLDSATQAWEAMMLDLIHFVTDTPSSSSVSHQEVGVDPRGFDSPPPSGDVPLFLPDLTSPTSPLPPDPTPPPPPLFGTVTTLAIDLTGEDDDEDIYESPSSRGRRLEREVTDADGMEVDEGIPIKSESSVA